MILDEWLIKYRDKFGPFPIYGVPLEFGTEEKMIDLIKKCLEENKEATNYFPDYNADDRIY